MATNSRHLDDHWVQELTGREQPKATSATAASLDRREAERVTCETKVFYVCGSLAGEAQLFDLSKDGCRIWKGPILPVGNTVSLTLHLNDGHAPLCFTEAVVCWNGADSFGVKFPALSREDRLRLQTLVLKSVSLRSGSEEFTAFRLV